MSCSEFIKRLQSSELHAECTHCHFEFKLSDAQLFDGRGAFPEAGETKRQEMLQELARSMNDFKKRKLSAGTGAEKKAIEIGIGKIIEKIVPAYKEFKVPIFDCRPLFEAVDFIVFNGLCEMSIKSVTFLEVKTGGATLNKHERMIRDAVEEKKVFHKVI